MKAKLQVLLVALLLPISCLGEVDTLIANPMNKKCSKMKDEKVTFCGLCDEDPDGNGDHSDSTCVDNYDWNDDVKRQSFCAKGTSCDEEECCVVSDWEAVSEQPPTKLKLHKCQFKTSTDERCEFSTKPKSKRFLTYIPQFLDKDNPDSEIKVECVKDDGTQVDPPGSHVSLFQILVTCGCE